MTNEETKDLLARMGDMLAQADLQFSGDLQKLIRDESHTDFNAQTVQELAFLLNDFRILYEEADNFKKLLGRLYDDIRVKHLPEKMDDDGISSIKIDELGTVILTDDLRVKVMDKQEQFDWLESTQNGDMIQSTVNASSLKALLRRLMKAGEEVPGDIFEISPFTRASIRKR